MSRPAHMTGGFKMTLGTVSSGNGEAQLRRPIGNATALRARALLGALALSALTVGAFALLPAARSTAASPQPYGCDSTRAGVRHHVGGQSISTAPGAIPCLMGM